MKRRRQFQYVGSCRKDVRAAVRLANGPADEFEAVVNIERGYRWICRRTRRKSVVFLVAPGLRRVAAIRNYPQR
jgi:hypothetical protein